MSRTRARAQRLVSGGTFIWQGLRTIREVKPARQASPVFNRIVERFSFEYPSFSAHPELPDLPFTYPLPYGMLRDYDRA